MLILTTQLLNYINVRVADPQGVPPRFNLWQNASLLMWLLYPMWRQAVLRAQAGMHVPTLVEGN
jgi:hypothetical protein